MVLSGSSKPTSTARPPGCGPACRRTRRFTTSPCAATRRGGDGGAERRTPPVGAALRQLAVAQAAPSYAASARKQPYCFRLRGERPWAFAGLWERWQEPGGDPVESFTILTTEANELVRPVHDRMPVIVPERHWVAWLDPQAQDAGGLVPLLRPYPADAMLAYPVGLLVNNPKNDGPRCLAPAQ